MTIKTCDFCGKLLNQLPFKCKRCRLILCEDCRLPEMHECKNFNHGTAVPLWKKLESYKGA